MTHRLLPFLMTALAPLIWGSTYLVTTTYLPPERPLTAAVLRALPAGLLLLLWAREWPRRQEVARLIVLGILNIGLFQAMLFISAYRLPGGLAAILNSTQTLWVLAFMALAGTRRRGWRGFRPHLVLSVSCYSSPRRKHSWIPSASQRHSVRRCPWQRASSSPNAGICTSPYWR